MATYDITLPIMQPVAFAPRCVVCEAKNPDGKISLSFLGANSTSYFVLAEDYVFDENGARAFDTNTSNKIDGIPACQACVSGLKWYHRLLKFAMYTAWLPGLILMLVLPGPIFLRVPVLIAFIIAAPILSMIFPPAFGATFMNGKANFEFKSKTVADEFRQLNQASVITK